MNRGIATGIFKRRKEKSRDKKERVKEKELKKPDAQPSFYPTSSKGSYTKAEAVTKRDAREDFRPIGDTQYLSKIPYKKGDFIGQKYEIYGTLGIGGFGVVYLVYSHETKNVYALKTFKDEYLEDAQIRERFRKEAYVWVNLERHPYILRAYIVDEIGGSIYIAMEYIAPNELGFNSLEGYLRRRPPNLIQSLRWSIQFCYGMEYAYSKGIRCHRDIKPANIMISQDKTVKISDFGLADVLGASKAMREIKLNFQEGRVGLSGQTMGGANFGTPTHMPPEQFINAASCDERSDIYAFGIVLYQMATGGKFPFLATLPINDSEEEMRRFWRDMHKLHSESPVAKLDSPLFPMIQRCLEKEPGRRYQSFRELRKDLEPLLKRETREVIKPPVLKELEIWEWGNKGNALNNLGRFEEAIHCCDKALEFDPKLAKVWNNKGNSLYYLGRFSEAIYCYDKAIELDPRYPPAWNNKGNILDALGRFSEAAYCYDKAIEIDPRYPAPWNNKGSSYYCMGRFKEAIQCFNESIDLDPKNPKYWSNKGSSLSDLGRFKEALHCHDKALELDPMNIFSWNNKGNTLLDLDRLNDALQCFNQTLEINPMFAEGWYNKAIVEEKVGRRLDAARSYKQFIKLVPAQAQYAQQIDHARKRLRELEGR